MISPTTPQIWVPDGLVGLIIPNCAILAEVLESVSAQRLIAQGAQVYLGTDGQTSILALKRPPGAVPMAVTVKTMLGKAA